MLEKESKIFNEQLSELIKSDIGKFVLIKDDIIVGTFAALVDALKSGYEKFREQPFFVRQILPTQQPMNFANNYMFN